MGATARVQNVPRSPVTSSFLILGGGFGLYGYLPAALANDYEVTTLARYREFLLSREDLRDYVCKLAFVSEANLDFNSFDAVVIAKTPAQQLEILEKNSKFQGRYYLEKPLGADSQNHHLTLNILRQNKLRFSVAYIFRYLEWYQAVVDAMQSDCTINIVWKVSHNPTGSWKGATDSGGGLISYYGVHLLSLILDLEVSADSLVFSYRTDCFEISSKSKAKKLSMRIEYSDKPLFRVGIGSTSGNYSWDMSSPFGPVPSAGLRDPRVVALTEYLKAPKGEELIEGSFIHELGILNFRRTIENLL